MKKWSCPFGLLEWNGRNVEKQTNKFFDTKPSIPEEEEEIIEENNHASDIYIYIYISIVVVRSLIRKNDAGTLVLLLRTQWYSDRMIIITGGNSRIVCYLWTIRMYVCTVCSSYDIPYTCVTTIEWSIMFRSKLIPNKKNIPFLLLFASYSTQKFTGMNEALREREEGERGGYCDSYCNSYCDSYCDIECQDLPIQNSTLSWATCSLHYDECTKPNINDKQYYRVRYC